MDDAFFRRLVAAYEHDSRDDPARFARRTAAMAGKARSAASSTTRFVWSESSLTSPRSQPPSSSVRR